MILDLHPVQISFNLSDR